MNEYPDPDRLRLTDTSCSEALGRSSRRLPRHRPGQEFLKGPIPLSWLSVAASLPGKAPLAVGLALWFRAGATLKGTVRLSGALLDRFGVKPGARRRGLAKLEAAGLVAVDRHPGRCPVVTIRYPPEASSHVRGEEN